MLNAAVGPLRSGRHFISEPPHQFPFESTIRPASDITPKVTPPTSTGIRVFSASAEVDVAIPMTGDALAMWSSDFHDLYWGTPSLAWPALCILDVILFIKSIMMSTLDVFLALLLSSLALSFRVLDSACAFPFTFNPLIHYLL
jgi:hypothetical protein